MNTTQIRSRDIIKTLRARWGTMRYGQTDEQAQRKQFLETNIQPFFPQQDTDQQESPIRLEQLEEFRAHMRAIQRKKWSLLQTNDEESDQTEKDPMLHASRQELLGEIATEQFRSGMLSWLTTVQPENALSSTPLEELEEIERQTKYRLRVVEVVQLAMEQELNAIEKEVRAKRLRAAQITPDSEERV